MTALLLAVVLASLPIERDACVSRIYFIKSTRDGTGWGLRESKRFVDDVCGPRRIP